MTASALVARLRDRLRDVIDAEQAAALASPDDRARRHAIARTLHRDMLDDFAALADAVARLERNAVNRVLDEALNSGDGSYTP